MISYMRMAQMSSMTSRLETRRREESHEKYFISAFDHEFVEG